MRIPNVVHLALLLAMVSVFGVLQRALSFEPNHHEQQWLVDSIGRDVTEMIVFAAKKNQPSFAFDTIDYKTSEKPPAENSTSYDITLKLADHADSQEIRISEYIWSPDNFSSWVHKLLDELSLKPSSKTPSSDNLIQTLSEEAPESFAQENKQVSSQLSDDPLNSQLHNQAALLCAAMALKECAACFTDVRPMLNRTSAHLTLAKALNSDGSLTNDGKLAEIVLNCLGGREAQAVSLIETMEKTTKDPATLSWLRAMRIRATHDYRIADKENGTALEKIEYFRALTADIGADALTDYLKARKVRLTMDWLRIGYRGINSVQAGHIYAEPGMNMEMADYKRAYGLYHPDDPTSLQAAQKAHEDLNLEPTRCLVHEQNWKLDPISWADIAAFHNRHVLDSVYQKYDFEENKWGVPDEAQNTYRLSENLLSSLRLYPLCKLDMLSQTWDESKQQRKKADQQLSGELGSLMEKYPQQVVAELWCYSRDFSEAKDKIPVPSAWFDPRIPIGTAFDYHNRRKIKDFSVAEIEDLRKLVPFNGPLLLDVARRKYGEHPTSDQFYESLKLISDYDLGAIMMLANAEQDPIKHVVWLEKAAKLKPDVYIDLGTQFEVSNPEKAREAFENAMKFGTDDVKKANNCSWLVDYYLDHDKKDEAKKLATFAGEVYSYGGLGTLAHFYERQGQLKEAEKTYKDQVERYTNETWDLNAFYLRNKNNPLFKAESDKVVKYHLSYGLNPVKLSDFKTPPTDGVKIAKDSELSRANGLKKGVVIVAVDGIRIKDHDEFNLAREVNSRNKSVELIYWDGSGYHSLKGSPPNRRFGFTAVDNKN